LLCAPNLERNIFLQSLRDIHNNVRLRELLKTLHCCFQSIAADTNVREAINARSVRYDLPYLAGREVFEENRDARNQAPARIRHGSRYRGVILPPSSDRYDYEHGGDRQELPCQLAPYSSPRYAANVRG